jgi:putative membrane protein
MPNGFGPALAALVFGLIGIIITMLGFKVFDWITPRIDLQKELAERNNLAVAIVIASVILGISYIAAQAIS